MLLLVAGICSLPLGAWGGILGVFLIVAAVVWKIGGAILMSKRQQQAENTTAGDTSRKD
jgi:hypothetical protein